MKTTFRSLLAASLANSTARKTTQLLTILTMLLSWHCAHAQPTITQDPTDASVSLNATAQLKVIAESSGGALTYLWWFKDAALDRAVNPSAARSTLLLSNVTEAIAGAYWAVVSDDNGSATSQVATLTVDPTFTKVMKGALVQDRLNSWYGHWGDYDNDDRLDVLVLGYANQWRLYHNDGNALFSAVTNGVMSQRSQGMAGAWGDPNNDGGLDWYAGPTSSSESPGMYWNDGKGNFVRQAVIPLRGGLNTWGDFDRDGFLDAFLGGGEHYVSGITVTNSLLHSNGDGTFAVVTNSVLNLKNDGTQNSCAVDYDNDGSLDLVLARFAGLPTQFYHNDGHGVFSEATPEPILSEIGYRPSAAWADFDNDGDQDVIFGGYGAESERFYVRNGDGTFSPWTGQPSRFENELPAGWFGVEYWGDFDNDGYLDLLCCDVRWHLWRNLGDGNFVEIPAGSPVTDPSDNSQSACWIDFNNDGFLDVFMANHAGGNYLYMNNGNTNRWLEVKLRGTVSDRMAVGAKVFVTANVRGKVMRQLRVITATVCEQTLVAHFGLGDATKVDAVRIEWPLGIVQELVDVPVNQILTVTEHQAGAPTPPTLTASKSAAGELQLTAAGPTNFYHVFEASKDLVQWTKIAVRLNQTGTVEFTDTATTLPQRFYRVQVP